MFHTRIAKFSARKSKGGDQKEEKSLLTTRSLWEMEKMKVMTGEEVEK